MESSFHGTAMKSSLSPHVFEQRIFFLLFTANLSSKFVALSVVNYDLQSAYLLGGVYSPKRRRVKGGVGKGHCKQDSHGRRRCRAEGQTGERGVEVCRERILLHTILLAQLPQRRL